MEVKAAAGATGESGRHSWVQRQTYRAVSQLIREKIMTWGKREGPLKAQLYARLVVKKCGCLWDQVGQGPRPSSLLSRLVVSSLGSFLQDIQRKRIRGPRGWGGKQRASVLMKPQTCFCLRGFWKFFFSGEE